MSCDYKTCSSPVAMNIPMTGRTAPFIVIETDILLRGIPSNKTYVCHIVVVIYVTQSH